MTREEALIMLKFAPNTERPSALNPSLTQAVAVDIVRKAVLTHDGELPAMLEKRVRQVSQNRKRENTVW